MTVKICNGVRENTIVLDESSGTQFVEAIRNCINEPVKYPLVNYISPTKETIFTAEYLKQSLITIIK